VLLELGGKAPLIVLADADLERAAAAASFGAFLHQGQICMSTERLIVDRLRRRALRRKLLAAKARERCLSVGDPREPETQIGPLINDRRAGARRRSWSRTRAPRARRC
jgi:vanillin dehydrogenase